MPNISYAELTDALIAAYCPAVANMANLTVSERWRRMRQFDTILQQQLAAALAQQRPIPDTVAAEGVTALAVAPERLRGS